MEAQFSDFKSSSQDSQSFITKNSQNTQDRHILTKKRSIINCKTLPKYQESNDSSNNFISQIQSNGKIIKSCGKQQHIRSGSNRINEMYFNFAQQGQSRRKKEKNEDNNLNEIECINFSDGEDSVLLELNELLTTNSKSKQQKDNSITQAIQIRPKTSAQSNLQCKIQNFPNFNQALTFKKLGSRKFQNKSGNQTSKNQQWLNNWMLLSPRNTKASFRQKNSQASKKDNKAKKFVQQATSIYNNQQKLSINLQAQQMQIHHLQSQFQKPKTSSYLKNNEKYFTLNIANNILQKDKFLTTQQFYNVDTLTNQHTLQGQNNYNTLSERFNSQVLNYRAKKKTSEF